MQKKIIRAGIIALALVALISCQPRYQFIPGIPGIYDPSEPGTGASYTVTIVYNQNGVEDKVLTEQKNLAKPVDPTGDENHEFAYWVIDGVKVEESQWGTRLSGDVTLTAVWINIYDVIAEIPEYADCFTAPDNCYEFGQKTNKDLSIDGKGLIKIRKWQDIRTPYNLTLRNIIFESGISIHAENTDNITITVEGCEIHPCLQDELRLDKPTVTSNSGDGLCLGIDTTTNQVADHSNRGKIKIIVRNNHLVGDNNPAAPREGYKALEGNESAIKKSRGNGVSLGNQAGGVPCLSTAEISENTFEGLRGNALQLYRIADGMKVNVSGNKFISWGINADTLGGTKEDYAIRGELYDDTTSKDVIVLIGNSYADSMTVEGTTKDLEKYKVAINYWNGGQNGPYEQSKAE